ncbi:MAG: cupredoxin domain-containing protein [Myxococcales bacterium]|jgi:plastocyanin domain-containing protein|nr:cupredoxin domain-containing protein [Myxococcales bacterium]MBL0196687.1 cupredoxin domain-containing protein [Myxococcales bacterium]HQY60467.1 cupredoxin domain-containing protein [Polyangiaceae bacterium]
MTSSRSSHTRPLVRARLAHLAPLLAVGLSATALGCKTAPLAPGGGKVAVTADANGFSPSSVKVEKGAPLELTFTRTTEETCATKVVFPELGVTKELPLNTPVAITVPTGDARTLTFQCGMGMYKSKIVIQ